MTIAEDEQALALLKHTKMTLQDLKDFEECSPDEAAVLMQGYEDDGKIPDKTFWQKFGEDLQAIQVYAPIAAVILAAIPLL
jgi:hypothetical protein